MATARAVNPSKSSNPAPKAKVRTVTKTVEVPAPRKRTRRRNPGMSKGTKVIVSALVGGAAGGAADYLMRKTQMSERDRGLVLVAAGAGLGYVVARQDMAMGAAVGGGVAAIGIVDLVQYFGQSASTKDKANIRGGLGAVEARLGAIDARLGAAPSYPALAASSYNAQANYNSNAGVFA